MSAGNPMSEGERACVLITVSGQDRPGITAALTEIIAGSGVAILDMEQVVVQDMLNLSIVLDYRENGARSRPVLKDLLFAAKEMGVDLDFRVVPGIPLAQPRPAERFVLTMIGQSDLPPGAIARVAALLRDHGFNIDKIQKLDEGQARCLELVVATEDSRAVAALKRDLLPVGREHAVDLSLQRDDLFRRLKRLVVMDMDSTLVQGEAIDALAEAAGAGPAVREITGRAMNGELDFSDALRERVALLEGLPESRLAEIAASLPLMPGAERLIGVLKRLGYRTAVISGGFDYFSEHIRTRLGLDYAYANRLEVRDGVLTGRLDGAVIDGERKAELMRELARKEGLRLDQVIAIGDGANDLPMLSIAGLGIAFNAKPTVRDAAQHSLNQHGLDTILFLLGITQRDLDVLDAESARDGGSYLM